MPHHEHCMVSAGPPCMAALQRLCFTIAFQLSSLLLAAWGCRAGTLPCSFNIWLISPEEYVVRLHVSVC